MGLSESSLIPRFVRRVRWCVFVTEALRACGAVGLLGLGLWVLARLVGIDHGVVPWVALVATLGIACVYGLALAWRCEFSVEDATAQLDRRLGLRGLLVTCRESGSGHWEAMLTERLEFAGEVLPTPRVRGLWQLPAVAVLGWVLVAGGIWPDGSSSAQTADAAMMSQLETLTGALGLLRTAGLVDEETGTALTSLLDEVTDRVRRGEAVTWSDLDGIEGQLERLRTGHAGDLQRAAAGLSGLLDPQNAEALAGRLGSLAEMARASGLLEGAPDGLEQALAGAMAAAQGGELPAGVPDLVDQLAERFGERARGLSELGLLDPSQLEGLVRRLTTDLERRSGGSSAPVVTGSGAGGARRDGADPAAPTTSWEPQPEAGPSQDPERRMRGVAWRSRLLPRHRGAVQKFFESGRDRPGGNGGRR